MGSRIARLIGLTMMAGLAYVPAAQAGQHFSIRIGIGAGAPAAVVPVVRPGYVWQPGYYVRTRFGVEWVPGAWVPAPYGRVDRDRGYRADVYSRRDWDRNAYRDRDRDWDRDWDGNAYRGRDRDRDRDEHWNRDRDRNRDQDWRQ